MSTMHGLRILEDLYLTFLNTNIIYIVASDALDAIQTEERLQRHQRLCTREDYISTLHIMPDPGTKIKFKNWKYCTWAPFVIYADLESILSPIEQHKGATNLYQHHKACAASALLCSKIRKFDNQFCLFTKEDAVSQLLKQLIEWETQIIEYLQENRPMPPLKGEKLERHLKATVCCICHLESKPFDENNPNLRKVADHDHITGYYRGAAHDLCNRKRRVAYDIPIFIHNFRGYDSHLIITVMTEYPDRPIQPIAQNMERYLQLKWGANLVFRDTFQFLTSSLDSLIQSQKKTDETKFFKLNTKIAEEYPGVDAKLMLRKGVFPYEYAKSIEQLSETKLPPIEAFYSTLRSEACTPADYEYAQQIWNAFNCKTLEDYLKLYLLSDVCLLADVFQNFRDICYRNYKLDPAYFISAPQLSWNSMFKMLNLELELISDPQMYRLIQPNIRGGICHASGRYAKANNKYMGALYNPNEPSTYLMYIDATNLYGWALSQALPYSDFEWLSDEEKLQAEATLCNENIEACIQFFETYENTAYILEVDLQYPEELHDRDDDYPMAPELMEITFDMLSEKAAELHRFYYNESKPYSRKLICSLLPKKKYVVFSENLKFYIQRGMKVTKLHSAMKFKTQAMLAPYIDFNTKQRAASGNDECRRNFFKIMNNAVYGKTIENVLKRLMVKIYTDAELARKHAEKPHCINFKAFKEDLIALEMRQVNQVINKPFQIGFAVLEYSKLHMQRTYATLKDHFGQNMRLLYTDTDSFILQFFTDDLYKEILEHQNIRNLFDFSEIPANHPSGLSTPNDPNKGIVGFFKDETKANPVIELVALKPKMYSFTVAECCQPGSNAIPKVKSKQVGKGIARAALRTTTHEQYLDMFQEREATKVTNKRIGSLLHQVYTMSVEKRALMAFDDKRVLLANLPNGQPNPYTHAYGHYSLHQEVHVDEDNQHPDAGNELQIEEHSEYMKKREYKHEARLQRKHRLAVKKARILQRNEFNDDDPDLSPASEEESAAEPDVLEQLCRQFDLATPRAGM